MSIKKQLQKKSIGEQLVARKCDVTGEEMNMGYVVSDGDKYIKHEADLIKHLHEVERAGNPFYDEDREEGRLTDDWLLMDYYNNDYYYFTEWEDEDDN